MSAATRESTVGNGLGTVITAVAILVSIAVMAVLASTDVLYARQLRVSKVLASIVPAAGTLLGQNVDGSEWAPTKDGRHILVLFGIAEAGQTGDMDFWRDIALRGRKVAPDTEFVGLCVTDRSCKLPSGAEGALTLLKSMDPVQTHALTASISQGQAFVFRGSEAQGMLRLETNREAFAAHIAKLFQQKAKIGGS